MEDVQKITDSEVKTQMETYNKLFVTQQRKNKVQKWATFITTALHIFAYVPIVCNILYLLEDVELRPELLQIPVLGWFMDSFKFFHTDISALAIWSGIFLWVIPLAVYIIMFVVFGILNNKKEIPELNGKPAEQAAKLYKSWYSIESAVYKDRYLTKAATIGGVVVGIIILVLVFVYGEVALFNSGNVIFGGLIFSVILAGVCALLSLPLRWFTNPMKLTWKRRVVISNEKDNLYKLWCSIDPEEAERHKREEERRIREAEQRARQQEIRNNTKIVINYDDSIDTYGNLSLTVYIDGASHNLRAGRNAFTVSPGHHKLNCIVYNDGSESCSELGEIQCYVPSGETYVIDIPG